MSSCFSLALHGGAGALSQADMLPEEEQAYRNTLKDALQIGRALLIKGASALDTVCEVIIALEDAPVFNAGKGAVFNHEGEHSLDASIMNGENEQAGGVCAVQTIKNPIIAARMVLEKSPYVLLHGVGAESFAQEVGVECVPKDYFYTDLRWKQLEIARKEGWIVLDHGIPSNPASNRQRQQGKYGTVGAVALDQNGRLAAGSSTGGMTNKQWGRIGDTPIIGAGTYANQNIAVSCTGHGEYFLRSVSAYDVAARYQYTHVSLEEASLQMLADVKRLGGSGGLIAVSSTGEVTMPFNSFGMFCAWTTQDFEGQVKIWDQ